jgi:glycerol uptake facilitator-like aquaporin
MFHPLLVEFLGTALIVAAVSYFGTPLAVAGAVLVGLLVKPTANLNPAVTIWAYLCNKIGATTAIQNIAAQVAGAATVFALKI